MVEKNPRSVEYIQALITNLCGQCDIESSYDANRYLFRISAKGESSPVNLTFSDENLDDFEEVLKANDNSSYGRAFRSFVHFKAYVALGKAGLIPSFRVSEEFLKEERNWWTTQHAPVLIEEDLSKVIYRGLRKVEVLLSTILESSPQQSESLNEIKEDLERAKGILNYYETHEQSFNERSASVKSLRLLKAAVLVEIIELEVGKSGKPPTAIRAVDEAIYPIVDSLRKDTFLEIQLPRWIRDYIAFLEQRKQTGPTPSPQSPAGSGMTIFLSSTCVDLLDLREALAAFLTSRGIHVIRSEDPAFHDGSQAHPHDVCLQRVDETPHFLLVVDKQAGSEYRGKDPRYIGLTITHAEIQRARVNTEKKVYCFVRHDVWTFYDAWVLNGRQDGFKCRDIDKRVFQLLDYVVASETWRMTFSDVEDLKRKVQAKLKI